MIVKIYPVDEISGEIRAPPSKSYTHRALFTALLSTGTSHIVNPLYSRDTIATLDAIVRFGARISGDLTVTPPHMLRRPKRIYCRGSGTTLRIATAIAGFAGGPTLLYGDSTLNRRPMRPLLDALETLNVKSSHMKGSPPLIVYRYRDLPKNINVDIDASLSSQFVTALLIISPLVGLEIRVKGELRSKPYIDLTLNVMRVFGVNVEREDYRWFKIPLKEYKPVYFQVPGDYSSAAFILAAGALRGKVRVSGLDPEDPQGDKRFLEILGEMGVKVRRYEDVVEVEYSGLIEPVDVDCGDIPDIVPILSVLAAYADGVSKIRNVHHLAFKESNRLEVIRRNLEALGCEVEVENGDLIIRGKGRLRGGRVHSFKDHRIAMACAIAGLASENETTIECFERVVDSYPQFLNHLRTLGVDYEVL